jgi:hypothetical protein
MARLTTLLAGWVALNAGELRADGQAFADVLLDACAGLSDDVLRGLPALPEEAAEALASEPFAELLDGAYLASAWLESLSTGLELPLAEIDGGWDLSDGESVYFCPIVHIAEDAHEPADLRPFVRVDQIRRWPDPS